ncbi:unnamed protein product [Boreogadus saida]
MAEITTIAALNLLWEFEESRKPKRCCVWVHDILRRHSQLEHRPDYACENAFKATTPPLIQQAFSLQKTTQQTVS